MSLTAIEIKQQKFAKAMRGCDPAEVKAFLDLAANEWEHITRKNKELTKQVEDLEDKLDHYKEVEQDLHETLKTARESIQTKLDSVEQKAEHTIEKAEMQADSILKEAEQDRKKMHAHVLQLHNRRREISGSIRSYLKAAIDSLDHFDREQAERFDPPAHPSQSEASKKNAPSANIESIDELIDDLE